MSPQTPEDLAAALKQGRYDDNAPQLLLAQQDQFVADELASPTAAVVNDQIRSAVGVLNRHRHFDLTRLIGQAWKDTRGCDALIQKHLTQALIELGAFDAADRLLDEGFEAAATSNDLDFVSQVAEYQGLRGRILKQKFVQKGDLNLLHAATDAYLKQYGATRSFYHGVNVIALRLLEAQKGLPHRDGVDTRPLAKAVLASAQAERHPDAMPWPLATASEACLALHEAEPDAGWCDQAELWLYRFLTHPEAGPFAIESYHRQLREIWRGDPRANETCADRLAGIVERHVVRTQRRWSVDPARARELAAHPEELERTASRRKFSPCPTCAPCWSCVQYRLRDQFQRRAHGDGFPDARKHLRPGARAGVRDQPPCHQQHRAEIAAPGRGARYVRDRDQLAAGRAPDARVRPAPIPRPSPTEAWAAHAREAGETRRHDGLASEVAAGGRAGPRARGERRAARRRPPRLSSLGTRGPAQLQFSVNDSVLLDVCRYERLMHYRTPTDPAQFRQPGLQLESGRWWPCTMPARKTRLA